VGFPDIRTYPKSHPGPYEQQMGQFIVGLLQLFSGQVADVESHQRVLELAATPSRWSAGHAVFDVVRSRLLATADKDQPRKLQYYFEESCCQSMYNATDPPDPFDPSSAFFVAGQALSLARSIGVPVEAVVAVLAPSSQLGSLG